MSDENFKYHCAGFAQPLRPRDIELCCMFESQNPFAVFVRLILWHLEIRGYKQLSVCSAIQNNVPMSLVPGRIEQILT